MTRESKYPCEKCGGLVHIIRPKGAKRNRHVCSKCGHWFEFRLVAKPRGLDQP